MTFPSSLTKTFDTSLVDVNRSFSSTETNTSGGSSIKENQAPLSDSHSAAAGPGLDPGPSTTRDGALPGSAEEIFDAVDARQMRILIPQMLSTLQRSASATDEPDRPLVVLDVGCSSGRNMFDLLYQPWTRPAVIVHCEPSGVKLEALKATYEQLPRANRTEVQFDVVNLSKVAEVPEQYLNTFDAVVLCLGARGETLQSSFVILAKVLRRRGCAIVTGMHPDLNERLQAQGAGPVADLYALDEASRAASEQGLDLLGDVEEVTVTKEMVDQGVIAKRGEDWIGVKVWFGLKLRKA